MFLFIFIVILISFSIYMFLNDGYIYIASKHFEKEISIKKIKEKREQEKGPKCQKCGRYLTNKETNICSDCLNKELTNYSSSNEFGEKKNSKKIF